MLVKGWAADSKQRVRRVNRVLRDWVRRNRPEIEMRLNSAYGVPIVEFLAILLDVNPKLVGREAQPLESGILSDLGRHLTELPNRVNEKDYKYESGAPADGMSVRTEVYTLDIQRKKSDTSQEDYRGAEVRASMPGGFRIVDQEKTGERVEIVIFGQLRWQQNQWMLDGYQGLLERASQPDLAIQRENIRAGALALMGRNLSHNIGSHALYWLEQSSESLYALRMAKEAEATALREAEEAGPRIDTEADLYVPEHNDRQLSLFYKYVRERMELLAGLVTGVPLAPRTFPIKVMLDGFKLNAVLCSYLCKSEGVTKVDVEYAKEVAFNVSLPGGSVGMQLFYSLLENIIRDNAKYGQHGPSMGVKIDVQEVSDSDRYECLKIRVIGQQADNADYAAKFILEKLSTMQITDTEGKLHEGVWGIKERFIAATLLRGYALQDVISALTKNSRLILAMIKGEDAPASGDPTPLENKPILTVLAEDRRLVWEFYLRKGKDVLLIREAFFETQRAVPGIQYENFDWLRENLGDGSSIRHSFVVVWPRTPDSMQLLNRNRGRLPYRTFLVETGTVMAHSFSPLDDKRLVLSSDLPEVLYKAWVESLDPHLAGRYLLITGEGYTRILEWDAKADKKMKTISADAIGKCAADPACLGIFSRHWPKKGDDLFELGEGKHREVFGNSSLHSIFKKEVIEGVDKYALFESILVRVLIIDERLDQSVGDVVNVSHGVTVRDRLEMKGIRIFGEDFGGSDVPDLETLIEKTKQNRDYQFVCIHRGILDKLERTHKTQPEAVCEALSQYSKNVLIHSGRIGRTNMPDGVRTIPLSNVIEWKGAAVSKMDVVNELCSFRRPS